MARNKVYPTFESAVADISDGSTILIGGFGGPAGIPQNLIVSLRDQGAKNLTVIHNTAGFGLSTIGYAAPKDVIYNDHAILIENRQVKKVYASYPFPPFVRRDRQCGKSHQDRPGRARGVLPRPPPAGRYGLMYRPGRTW